PVELVQLSSCTLLDALLSGRVVRAGANFASTAFTRPKCGQPSTGELGSAFKSAVLASYRKCSGGSRYPPAIHTRCNWPFCRSACLEQGRTVASIGTHGHA